MTQAIVYTDGACSPNPGYGGWGAVIILNNERTEYSGAAHDTTNNRMEMMGVIEALEVLKIYGSPCSVLVYSDSKYICDAINKKWVLGWKKRNWVKIDLQPVKNQDLWIRLMDLMTYHTTVKLEWVRGHGDCAENNRCDELAVAARRSLEEQSKYSRTECDTGVQWLAQTD